jgi:hypothetical protein
MQRESDVTMPPYSCHTELLYSVAALLVGKMRFTPSQATEAYKKLEPALSVGPTEDEEERERNMDAFKKAFTEILEEHGFDVHSSMLSKEQDESEARMYVLIPIESSN